MSTKTSLLFAISAFMVTSVSAATVVPISGAGDFGLNTPLRDAPRTLQFVYDSSLLGDIPNGSNITGLAFRVDGGYSTWPSSSRTWTNYDIQMSTSLNDPGSLSLTFADNIAPDVVTVRSGALTVSAGSYPGGLTVNDFGPEIGFSTPYTYTGGDLLITIRHTGNGVDTQYMSTVADLTGAYQGFYSSSGYTAASADGFDSTPIIQLSFSSVPEPSTTALLMAGGTLVFVFPRRRTRKA